MIPFPQAGAANVAVRCQNFLEVDVSDPAYAAVEYLLLDPSCSGSGMWDTQGLGEDHKDPEAEEKRLTGLAEFQLEALLHAFKFPALRRVSYSTCSIHQEENEAVVKAALEADPKWRLVPALPHWPRRGWLEAVEQGDKCVRVDPEGDMMNGFFVACFERVIAPAQVEEGVRAEAKRCGDEQAAAALEETAAFSEKEKGKKLEEKKKSLAHLPKKAEKPREKRKRVPEEAKPKATGPLAASKKKKKRKGPGVSLKS